MYHPLTKHQTSTNVNFRPTLTSKFEIHSDAHPKVEYEYPIIGYGNSKVGNVFANSS